MPVFLAKNTLVLVVVLKYHAELKSERIMCLHLVLKRNLDTMNLGKINSSFN